MVLPSEWIWSVGQLGHRRTTEWEMSHRIIQKWHNLWYSNGLEGIIIIENKKVPPGLLYLHGQMHTLQISNLRSCHVLELLNLVDRISIKVSSIQIHYQNGVKPCIWGLIQVVVHSKVKYNFNWPVHSKQIKLPKASEGLKFQIYPNTSLFTKTCLWIQNLKYIKSNQKNVTYINTFFLILKAGMAKMLENGKWHFNISGTQNIAFHRRTKKTRMQHLQTNYQNLISNLFNGTWN